MRRLFALALSAAAFLAAQGLNSRSDWQFYRELSTASGAGIAALTLDAELLANTREDVGDLRIFDAAGKEVPYDLRVLRGERNVGSLESTEVGRNEDGDAAQITLDLGENPDRHNQVQIDAEGTNFRRQVTVFGSDDADQWTPLNEAGAILRLTQAGGVASVNRVQYPLSEQRYLRVTVARDPQADAEPPVIEFAAVQRTTVVPGAEQAIPAESVTRETIVEGELSASRYTIDLPGRIPLHALRFATSSGSFVRTYQLLAVLGDNIAPFPVSAGQLGRSEANPSTDMLLRFREVLARQLVLTVVDNGEEPLAVLEPTALFASRQLVADVGAAAQPLRLYYGNPTAAAPDYGLNIELPQPLDESIARLEAGPQQLNSAYEAPQPRLSERAPWLVYALTAAASLSLMAILRSLVFDVDT